MIIYGETFVFSFDSIRKRFVLLKAIIHWWMGEFPFLIQQYDQGSQLKLIVPVCSICTQPFFHTQTRTQKTGEKSFKWNSKIGQYAKCFYIISTYTQNHLWTKRIVDYRNDIEKSCPNGLTELRAKFAVRPRCQCYSFGHLRGLRVTALRLKSSEFLYERGQQFDNFCMPSISCPIEWIISPFIWNIRIAC